MAYRKIIVNDIEYFYTIGKSHTKVKGVGVFTNRDIGDPIPKTDKFIVTPYSVKNAINGERHHRPVETCDHGVVTHHTVLDPYFSEIHGEDVELINCQKCITNAEMDI